MSSRPQQQFLRLPGAAELTVKGRPFECPNNHKPKKNTMNNENTPPNDDRIWINVEPDHAATKDRSPYHLNIIAERPGEDDRILCLFPLRALADDDAKMFNPPDATTMPIFMVLDEVVRFAGGKVTFLAEDQLYRFEPNGLWIERMENDFFQKAKEKSEASKQFWQRFESISVILLSMSTVEPLWAYMLRSPFGEKE